jgi:hypothetical protein
LNNEIWLKTHWRKYTDNLTLLQKIVTTLTQENKLWIDEVPSLKSELAFLYEIKEYNIIMKQLNHTLSASSVTVSSKNPLNLTFS